jgi:hypothetical protein
MHKPRPLAVPTDRRGARALGRRWWGLLAGASAVLVAAGCSSVPVHAAPPATTSSSTTSTTAATAATPTAVCPLSGSPVAGVPQRPALAVKITNYAAGRPQTGLNEADIVFEEPVEGGITRFVAVFQCHDAGLVGPIRSARNIDIGILGQFGAPLLAHVGGIQPVIDDIDASPVINLDLGAHGTVDQHPSGRYAPYDTYASTSAMWGIKATDTIVPAPVFSYSDAAPSGPGVGPVASVAIPFSSQATVVWRYDSQLHAFQRYYGTTPDKLSTGAQQTAANVVVQFVQVTYGPWAENSEGGLEVQANLYDAASGPALIFRSGMEISGSWSRSSLSQATQFSTSTGQPIALQPGQTWVELVPSTVTVTGTPPG